MKTKKTKIIVGSVTGAVLLLLIGGYILFQSIAKPISPSIQESADNNLYSSVTITRAELDTEFEDIQSVLMSAKAAPYRLPEQETILGFQITEIQPDTFWFKFGFLEGDIVTHIDGKTLNSPASAMMLYSTLTAANLEKIEFKIMRNDASGIVLVNIK